MCSILSKPIFFLHYPKRNYIIILINIPHPYRLTHSNILLPKIGGASPTACATQNPGARAAGNPTYYYYYWQCQQYAEPPATRAPRPGAAHTIQETPPTVYTSFIHTIRTCHTNSYHTHTTKFIYIYIYTYIYIYIYIHTHIYIYTQHARGAHTQRKRTHTSTHTHAHTIQIILYTHIHI